MKRSESLVRLSTNCPEWVHAEGIAPLPFHRGVTVAEMLFYKNIVDNFMVYKGRLETKLFQLFAHSETSEWFSIIPVLYLRSTSLLNRNKLNW